MCACTTGHVSPSFAPDQHHPQHRVTPECTPRVDKSLTMAAIIILAACCAAWLPVALLQAPTPITTSLKGLCHVSQTDLRVLPSQGFTRSLEAAFSTATAPAPIPALSAEAGCLFQSEQCCTHPAIPLSSVALCAT